MHRGWEGRECCLPLFRIPSHYKLSNTLVCIFICRVIIVLLPTRRIAAPHVVSYSTLFRAFQGSQPNLLSTICLEVGHH